MRKFYEIGFTPSVKTEQVKRESCEPDAAGQTRVVAWLFYSANGLHNGIGLPRSEQYSGFPSGGAFTSARAARSLDYLDRQLTVKHWLEPDGSTLADVATYPFMAVATEAEQTLERRVCSAAWLDRLSSLAGIVRMPLLAENRA